MKWYCITGLFFVLSCHDRNPVPSTVSQKDIVVKQDTAYINQQDENWQSGFDLTHDTSIDSIWFRPVSYYFNMPGCSGLAKDFYYGRLRPSDDGTTEELLKLVTTGDDKLRPLYRWCLQKTIAIQDGALAEMTGVPARRYAEKFPKEFFGYMNADSSGCRLKDWAAAINYSGYFEGENAKDPLAVQSSFKAAMVRNCKDVDPSLLRQVQKFAALCFSK